MMNILVILCSLFLATSILSTVFTVLLYNRMNSLVTLNGAYQAEEYRKAVSQNITKPLLKSKKEKTVGRKIEKNDDLVDMTNVPWEEGYKAVEDLSNG